MHVRVRMYRQGLGDCFLLTFQTKDGEKHALIDCGTLGATTTGVKLADVVADIAKVVKPNGDRLDLLVATHEHKDHLSGFLTEHDAFENIKADHVWQAWTEDGTDPIANQLQKYDGDLVQAARLTSKALDTADPADAAAAALGAGVRKLLGFSEDVKLGAFAKTVNDAMTYVTKKNPAGLKLLRPAEDRKKPEDPLVTRPALEPEWLPGVRVYVLGPPRDTKAIANMGEHGSPDLYELAAQQASALMASAEFYAANKPYDEYVRGLEDSKDRDALTAVLPFDSSYRLDPREEEVRKTFASYYRPGESWRRVDYDWLATGAELALQLDTRINNTSLALAFELIDDGRVLLFPADAQLGNWLSWHDLQWTVKDDGGAERQVTVTDLLARTVFYKVGHHSSHNATLSKRGLELMTSKNLVAFIPVDRAVALKKKPPWVMPARALYRRLIEKAAGRVVRSDVGWASKKDQDKRLQKLFTDAEWEQWAAAQQAAEENGEVTTGDDLFFDWNG